MEEKLELEVDVKKVEKAIFGEKTKNFKYVDLNNWKNLAKRELERLVKSLNGDYGEVGSYKVLNSIDLYLLNDIANFLGNIKFVPNEDVFVIDDEIVDVNVAETIYNFYIQNTCENKETRDLLLYSKENKTKRIKEFLNLVEERKVVIKIFKNERQVIEYLFIEDKDIEQQIDGIQRIIEKGFKFDKSNNIIKIHDNMYVYILY